MAIIRYSEPIYKNDRKFPTCHGTKEIDDFQLKYKDNGGVELKKTGTKPIYKIIQASKVNCDLQAVLEQCVHENQLSPCTADDFKSVINDFSGMQSMPELFAGMRNLNETWNKLPLEVREQFGSSQVAFVNGLASPDFMDKVNAGFTAFDKSISKRIDVPKPTPTPTPTPTPAPDVEPLNGGDE